MPISLSLRGRFCHNHNFLPEIAENPLMRSKGTSGMSVGCWEEKQPSCAAAAAAAAAAY